MIRFFAILAGLFLLAGAASAQSCPTREDLALVGSAPGAQYGDCRELARFTIQTGREDIPAAIFGAADTDPRAVMQIRGALIKAGDTVKALAPLGSRPVKIYISPTQNVEPQIYEDAASQQGTMVVDAQTAPSVDRQTCVIGIFPPAMAASPQSRTHTVAHEFFHCVIITEYPHRDTARGATWWVEGAAEWFASHVYENTPESDGAVATFDQFSVETPLTRMAYGNVVFFWWLEQKYGTDGVFGLINAMPVRGSQDDALAGFMADSAFREFAKAYLDGDIVQPGGRVVASNPDFGATITVENGVPFEVSAPRHVLFRATVEFSCGLWQLRQQGLRGLYAAQPASSAVWGDLPETIDREYGETLQLAGGATEASGFFTKIMADKDFCAPCSVPDYTDGPAACLVGDWVLESGGLAQIQSALMNEDDSVRNADMPDPDHYLTLNADGTFVIGPQDTGHIETINSSGDVTSSDLKLTLTRRGNWSAGSKILDRCYQPVGDLVFSGTASDSGGSRNFSVRMPGGPTEAYTESKLYTCEGDTLQILYMRVLFKNIYQNYRRVGR